LFLDDFRDKKHSIFDAFLVAKTRKLQDKRAPFFDTFPTPKSLKLRLKLRLQKTIHFQKKNNRIFIHFHVEKITKY
jgi:hypothetical protein